jgi:hypothetical protein
MKNFHSGDMEMTENLPRDSGLSLIQNSGRIANRSVIEAFEQTQGVLWLDARRTHAEGTAEGV